MRQRRKEIRSSSYSIPSGSISGERKEDEPHTCGSSSDGGSSGHRRRGRRHQSNCNDFRVHILKFEGKLDLDEFLEWMQTVQRIFEYRELPKDKKVKLVAPQTQKVCLSLVEQLAN